MKNHAILELITVPYRSTWSLPMAPYLFDPASFDGGDRLFRDGRGTPIPEAVLVGSTRLRNCEGPVNLGQNLWHGIRITMPAPLDELCWTPYSIGDQIVDEREPGFPISNKIDWIEVRISVDSWDLYYVFTNGIGIDHRDVCEKVNEGQFRIIAGGDQ
jgi:hypothetical protein